MTNRIKIIFFGEDSFSAIVLQSLVNAGHHVQLVISPWYDNSIYKRLELTAEKNSVKYCRELKINSEELIKKIHDLAPDLIVVAHFERLLKKDVIEIPRLGCINLHPSLLPYYRGMAPQHWPIINGDAETGVTVHYINEGIDTGHIILQERIELYRDMYVSDLQFKWVKIYEHIVVDAIECILNKQITYKQDCLVGSYYGKLTQAQCRIDLEGTKIGAYNLIRGVSRPYYGAELNGIKIWTVHICDVSMEILLMNEYQLIGVYFTKDNGNFIRFKDGVLIIDKFENQNK